MVGRRVVGKAKNVSKLSKPGIVCQLDIVGKSWYKTRVMAVGFVLVGNIKLWNG